jgi:hypothetical protein
MMHEMANGELDYLQPPSSKYRYNRRNEPKNIYYLHARSSSFDLEDVKLVVATDAIRTNSNSALQKSTPSFKVHLHLTTAARRPTHLLLKESLYIHLNLVTSSLPFLEPLDVSSRSNAQMRPKL